MKSRQHSVSQVARLLEISVDTIRRYEKQGVYTARRIFNQRILTNRDIEAIKKHRVGLKPGRPRTH